MWHWLKGVALSNVCCDTLQELRYELRLALARLRHRKDVLAACIRRPGYIHSVMSVSIMLGAFLVARGNAPKLLEAVDHPLNPIARPVQLTVERSCPPLRGFPLDRHAAPAPSQILPNLAAALAFVTADAPWTALGAPTPRPLYVPLLHEWLKDHAFMALPSSQHEGHRLAAAFGTEVDFGANAALTAP